MRGSIPSERLSVEMYMWKKIAYYILRMAQDQDWPLIQEEGRLALDVFRDGSSLIVRSPLAGVTPQALDIAIDGDLLTIRGTREEQQDVAEDDWFLQECYWGSFSRSLILPMDVESDRAAATLKNGVLEIRIPLKEGGKPISIHPRLIEE